METGLAEANQEIRNLEFNVGVGNSAQRLLVDQEKTIRELKGQIKSLQGGACMQDGYSDMDRSSKRNYLQAHYETVQGSSDDHAETDENNAQNSNVETQSMNLSDSVDSASNME